MSNGPEYGQPRAEHGWADQDRVADLHLEQRLDAALMRAPDVDLPENFAARVAAELTPSNETPHPSARYGQRVLLWCGALLAVVLMTVMVAGPGQQPRWLVSLLSLELALLALGAGSWRRVLRWPA